jgi:hypothetical protein
MKWVAIILMGIFMSGCATGPIVTHRQLAPKQYEITLKSGLTDFSWDGGCATLYDYSKGLCKGTEGTGAGSFKIKKFDTNAGTVQWATRWTSVSIIECLPKGFWAKKNGDRSQYKKDLYGCEMNAEMLTSKTDSRENVCETLFRFTRRREIIEKCLRAKDYEFIMGEEREKEDLKTPYHKDEI